MVTCCSSGAGYFARSVHTIFEDNPAVAQILATGAVDKASLTSEFLSTILSLVGIVEAVGGVQIVHRVRAEELGDRLEIVLAVAVTGAHPAVSLAAWAGVLISFVPLLLGPTFKLWDSILAISPFWHVPSVTDADADWWGLVWISLVTLALCAIGGAGFRRRDIGAG